MVGIYYSFIKIGEMKNGSNGGCFKAIRIEIEEISLVEH